MCPTGSPTCDYDYIQDAVDKAVNGDVIKVAAGTYTDINTKGGTVQVVYLDKSITIRGGYTTNFTEPPDPEANPTTLDAKGKGRVLNITGDVSPTIEGLHITGGDPLLHGNIGGGMYINSAAADIRNNRFFSNTAASGGGLALVNSDSMLRGNTFIGNTATNEGGGLALYSSDATLIDNRFVSNKASGWGGGLFIGAGKPTLDANIISQNKSDGSGSGLVLDYSQALLTNNIISVNHGDSGLRISNSSPHLIHNTIAGNVSGQGRGIHVDNGSPDQSTVILTNNILVNQTVGIYVESGSSTLMEATLWGDGAWANGTDWAGGGTIYTLIDIWGNPDFVYPDAGDYHIGPDSDAIDQGVDAGVTNDIDHHPRPYQEPDIGADEYWPPGALKFIYLPVITR